MKKEERDVLEKAVNSREGQISPATMINSYAGGDQSVVERLVSQGYLERVYQFQEGLHQATYSIIFYAVTEKGLMYFAPFFVRVWFNFKSNTALWVGVFSIFVGATSIFFTGAGYFNSIQEDKLLNRPYYFVRKAEIEPLISEDFAYRVVLSFENTGRAPAFLESLKWGFTEHSNKLRNSENTFVVNPDSRKKAWILLSNEDVESIVKPNDNKLFIRFTYSDFMGTQYCTESEYSIVKPEGEFLLAHESEKKCGETSDPTASNQDEETT